MLLLKFTSPAATLEPKYKVLTFDPIDKRLPKFTAKLVPIDANPPPLDPNCTWPGPVPTARVKVELVVWKTPPLRNRLLVDGRPVPSMACNAPAVTEVEPE
jgi:hypothetical protein